MRVMDEFIALDVETANQDFASICSIGVVAFCDGQVVDANYTLVDPEDWFSGLNISIHGITDEDVRGAPTFPDIADDLRQRVAEKVVVTHTPFDRVALRQAHSKYGLVDFACQWLDSARVVRRVWPEMFAYSGYGLSNVAQWCGIEFEHHNALEDAKAAGEILVRAMSASGLSVSEWLTRARQPIDPDNFRREGKPDGPLYGERVCFTGALHMTRREAADRAAEAGCDVAQGISKWTTLLVVGEQDILKLAGHEKSSKHRKAEDMIRKGQNIRIVQESDFLQLISE